MRTLGLFAGIGGIELGFVPHGADTVALCEIMPEAQSILRHNFSEFFCKKYLKVA